MRFDILTLHPSMVSVPLGESILGRAQSAGHLTVGVHDIRDFSDNKHRTVDDTPYGGGAGMVLRVDVVARAIESVRTDASTVLLTTPKGRTLTQEFAESLVKSEHLVIVCGHYEGIDSRIETLVDGFVSLGDFVLTGGEIAAIALVDAVGRLLPGVLGNERSARDESFSQGLLEYPQYTRPREWRGQEVPTVLLSGHHQRIQAWRLEQAKLQTRELRPDLWRAYCQHPIAGQEKHDQCQTNVDESPSNE